MKSLFASVLLLLALTTASAQSPSAKLEGHVVCCADCWAEADRTKTPYGTAEDLLKAKGCVEGGDPTLLAVKDAGGEGFTLYQLEPGKFKLPGKNWLEFVGRRVAVEGAVRKKKDVSVVRVDALEVLAPSLAEQEATRVVGTEVELTLKDLFGAEQRLGSLKGRIVVLNFWATYCAPCRTEMPDLAAIQNEYAALGVQVVGASTDAPEDRAKVLQFIRETKINFPVWVGADAAVMSRFGLGVALPGTVVVGRDGRIVKVISGVVKTSELKQLIDSMLASAEAEGKGRDKQLASAKPKPAEASSVPS